MFLYTYSKVIPCKNDMHGMIPRKNWRRIKTGCGCNACVCCRCNINPSFPIDNVNDDKVDDACNIKYGDIDDIDDIDIDLMMQIMMKFALMDELNDWRNDSNDCR